MEIIYLEIYLTSNFLASPPIFHCRLCPLAGRHPRLPPLHPRPGHARQARRLPLRHVTRLHHRVHPHWSRH